MIPGYPYSSHAGNQWVGVLTRGPQSRTQPGEDSRDLVLWSHGPSQAASAHFSEGTLTQEGLI